MGIGVVRAPFRAAAPRGSVGRSMFGGSGAGSAGEMQDSPHLPLKWCSWCLQPAEMSLVEKRMASRNLYKCGNCSRLAVSCTACKCMARVHEEGDSRKEDRLCLRCDDPKPEEVVREAWCSWCVNLTMQRLQKASSFPGVRNYYHCGECGRGCVPCRTCSSGSARGRMGATKDDDMCLLCCGVVQDWHRFKGKENRLMTFGWCSWCYEKVEHVLEQANKMTRHVYTCTNCQGRTLQCS